MWLPEYERMWLKYFFTNVHYDKEGKIEYLDLPTKAQDGRKLYSMLESLETKIELFAALNRLIDRELLIADKNRQNSDLTCFMFEVSLAESSAYKLTLSGWDLANKYKSRFGRWGLFFNEYRDCGLGFILGLIGGLLTNVMYKFF